jgi:hypothetical protein
MPMELGFRKADRNECAFEQPVFKTPSDGGRRTGSQVGPISAKTSLPAPERTPIYAWPILRRRREFAQEVRGVRELCGDVRVDRDDALSGTLRGSLGCALKMPGWARVAHVELRVIVVVNGVGWNTHVVRAPSLLAQ